MDGRHQGAERRDEGIVGAEHCCWLDWFLALVDYWLDQMRYCQWNRVKEVRSEMNIKQRTPGQWPRGAYYKSNLSHQWVLLSLLFSLLLLSRCVLILPLIVVLLTHLPTRINSDTSLETSSLFSYRVYWFCWLFKVLLGFYSVHFCIESA